ncbi:MAG TPA: hypothetical protein VK705_07020 [Ferruginibacter sp.]|jgi:hypothetical protein|nr:hypothetical protein [Ferruginibacter sp.]
MKTTEVLNNQVNWHLNGHERYLDADNGEIIERISEQIQEGYSCGELVFYDKKDNMKTGWWDIPNFRDAACQLYHATLAAMPFIKDKGIMTRMKESITNFDKIWN